MKHLHYRLCFVATSLIILAAMAPGSTAVAATAPSEEAANRPASPSNLQITGQSADSISLAWDAPPPGNPLSFYQVYRNGERWDITTSTRYTDTRAYNACNADYTAPAALYSYAVSAVDTAGFESHLTDQLTFNVYYNGVYSWRGDYSYDAIADYTDTSGDPQSGAYDIGISITYRWGGFQPYAGKVVPQWDLEVGAFGYISMDLKPTIGGQVWDLSAVSRLPPGDVYPWAYVHITDFGPAPKVGVWATYKIPLAALSIGRTDFVGSISGNTLRVSSVTGGVGVDAGGFVRGPGVAAGTYITGYNAKGGPGTYTVWPAQYVDSTSMTEQRTAIYKIDLSDQTGASSNTFYIDNMMFTQY